jgi:hypothetical protein
VSKLQDAWAEQEKTELCKMLLENIPREDAEHFFTMGWHAGRISTLEERIGAFDKSVRQLPKFGFPE